MLDLDHPDTWPVELRQVLDKLRPVFQNWELELPGRSPLEFDAAVRTLGEALLPYALRGYHFTRLTEEEAEHIKANGLEVLSADLLERRIASQVACGSMTQEQANRLLANNQVRESNRAGMAWFCFYPAHSVRENGVRSLLEHCGGEALYNLNAEHPELGPLLKSLGRPALVEAEVPVEYLPSTIGAAFKVLGADLHHHGMKTSKHSVLFEDNSRQNLLPPMVRRVMLHPDQAFVELTQCQGWDLFA